MSRGAALCRACAVLTLSTPPITSPTEIDRMLSEVESEKEAREAKRQQRQQQP